MHLDRDRWLPVRRASGVRDVIAVADLAEPQDDPAVWPDLGREHLDAAAVDYLIARLQLALDIPDDAAWRGLLRQPPGADAIRADLALHADAFDLTGPAAFLQDPAIANYDPHRPALLLAEQPGDNALAKNTDHFYSRHDITRLHPGVAAMALYARQSFCPSPGGGFHTGPRGSSPSAVTTLLTAGDLWTTVVLNLLDHARAQALLGPFEPPAGEPPFVWTTPAGDEKSPVPVAPSSAARALFPCPMRYLLQIASVTDGACDVSGLPLTRAVVAIRKIKGGRTYHGAFAHPLAPTRTGDLSDPARTRFLRLHRHLSFEDYLGLVLPRSWRTRSKDTGAEIEGAVTPALAVTAFASRRRRLHRDMPDLAPRLFAFAYDATNAEIHGFRHGEYPLLPPFDDTGAQQAFEADVRLMVALAQETGGRIDHAVRAGLGQGEERVRDASGRAAKNRSARQAPGAGAHVDEYLARAGAAFSEALGNLHGEIAACPASGDGQLAARARVKEIWLIRLRRIGLALFDQYCPLDAHALDRAPEIASARRGLRRWLSAESRRAALHLPRSQETHE